MRKGKRKLNSQIPHDNLILIQKFTKKTIMHSLYISPLLTNKAEQYWKEDEAMGSSYHYHGHVAEIVDFKQLRLGKHQNEHSKNLVIVIPLKTCTGKNDRIHERWNKQY